MDAPVSSHANSTPTREASTCAVTVCAACMRTCRGNLTACVPCHAQKTSPGPLQFAERIRKNADSDHDHPLLVGAAAGFLDRLRDSKAASWNAEFFASAAHVQIPVRQRSRAKASTSLDQWLPAEPVAHRDARCCLAGAAAGAVALVRMSAGIVFETRDWTAQRCAAGSRRLNLTCNAN